MLTYINCARCGERIVKRNRHHKYCLRRVCQKPCVVPRNIHNVVCPDPICKWANKDLSVARNARRDRASAARARAERIRKSKAFIAFQAKLKAQPPARQIGQRA